MQLDASALRVNTKTGKCKSRYVSRSCRQGVLQDRELGWGMRDYPMAQGSVPVP